MALSGGKGESSEQMVEDRRPKMCDQAVVKERGYFLRARRGRAAAVGQTDQ